MNSLRNYLFKEGNIIIDFQNSTKLDFTTNISSFMRSIKEEINKKNTTPLETFELVKQFHIQAGSFTEAVDKTIQEAMNGKLILRIFHQPNTFAALNIIGLIIIADYLRKAIGNKFVVLFIAMDYDNAGDTRFRTPLLPNYGNSTFNKLAGAVPQRYYKSIACSVPNPPGNIVDGWISTFKGSIRKASTNLQSKKIELLPNHLINKNIDELSEVISNFYKKESNLTLSNTNIISWLINNKIGLDTLFIPSSWLLKVSYQDINSIISNKKEENIIKANFHLNEALEQFQISNINFIKPIDFSLWMVTNEDYKRVDIPSEKSVSALSLGEEYKFFSILSPDAPAFRQSNPKFWVIPKLVPKVTLCDLIELYSYNLRLGINYIGSIEHMFKSRFLASQYGLESKEFFWEPQNLFGISSSEDLEFGSGKFASFFYYSIMEKDYIAEAIINSLNNELYNG